MGRSDELVARCRFTTGERLHLANIDPADTGRLITKRKAQAAQAKGIEKLNALQERLYAQDRWAVLLVFQGMDAAGKDGTIKHVMSGVNPQGCEVHSFKAPSTEELDHDFLWRCAVRLPERGRIGIFNRSYYEEVLVVRVHPELLERQHLPSRLVGRRIWKERFEDINAFERHLARNGTLVLKFFLHVSRGEQHERFLERLDTPEKSWKFSPADFAERHHWDAYMTEYEEMLRATATRHAPWYVVPGDHKWFAHFAVAEAVIAALEELDLAFPKVDSVREKELKKVRTELKAEAVEKPE
jgi:PPK2 family polyphosphate:nucleotide phosphotransferase